MTHTTAELLGKILDLWPELDTVPTGRRRNIPRERTAEQRERWRERWEDELTDKQAGAIGRGASPAPCDLDQLQAKLDATAELCELADRVASRVQPAAEPGPVDPGHWDYSHRHGAPWAVTWLLGALDRGLPTLVADDVAVTAAHVLRQLRVAVDGQTERSAGRCPCGTPLTVADWDNVVTCPNCRTAYGRRDWLQLRDQGRTT